MGEPEETLRLYSDEPGSAYDLFLSIKQKLTQQQEQEFADEQPQQTPTRQLPVQTQPQPAPAVSTRRSESRSLAINRGRESVRYNEHNRSENPKRFRRHAGNIARKMLGLGLATVAATSGTVWAANTPQVDDAMLHVPSRLVNTLQGELTKHQITQAPTVNNQEVAANNEKANSVANDQNKQLPAEAYNYQQYLANVGDTPNGSHIATVKIGDIITNHNVNKSDDPTSVAGLDNYNNANIWGAPGAKLGGDGATFIYDHNTGLITQGFSALGLPSAYGDGYIDPDKGLLNGPMVGRLVVYTMDDGTTQTFAIKQAVFADLNTGAILNSNGQPIPNTKLDSANNPWNDTNSKLDDNGNVIPGTEGQGNANHLGVNAMQTCANPGSISLPGFNDLDKFDEYANRKVGYLMEPINLTKTMTISHPDGTKTTSQIKITFGIAGEKPNVPGTGAVTPVAYSDSEQPA